MKEKPTRINRAAGI